MAGLDQGMKLKEQKEKKVTKGFESGTKEGFSGILGSNADMDNVITSNTAQTKEKTTHFNNNIAQYGSDYDALKKKTHSYLNNSENDYALKKNYNVFFNKRATQSEVTGKKQKGCVTFASINNDNLKIADGFDTAYPNNFTNYTDAENACKLWAIDSGKTVYALNQDSTGKYQCRTGQGYSELSQYTKPSTLYKVLTGNEKAKEGGLFGNGQIGTWSGQTEGRRLPPMTDATLLVKYNSDSYGWGPRPTYYRIWGPPSSPGGRYTGWGNNYWPSNRDAWWISTNELYYVGTMGYFYYEYKNPSARKIVVYIVSDDAGELKVNGTVMPETRGPYGQGGHAYFDINIDSGVIIFNYKLINGGGPGAFVFYAQDYQGNVLFTSGPGWVYSKINNEDAVSDPYRVTTLNIAPTGYEKCDRIIGGGINRGSITATYGRNCSYDTQPAPNIRYVVVWSNPAGECLQISQIVVNSMENGSFVNVAPRGRIFAASPTWPGNGNHQTRPETAIDGHQGARSYPSIYHSICNRGTVWALDLGKEYPVSQIKYYNRSDCCSGRANGMTIKLWKGDGQTMTKTLTLSGALEQVFQI